MKGQRRMRKDGRIRPNSPSLMTKEATIVYIYKHRTAAGREIRTGQLLWSFKAIFFAIQCWQKVIDTSHVPLSFISTEGALGLPTTKQWLPSHQSQPNPISQSLFNHLNRPWIDLSRPPMTSNAMTSNHHQWLLVTDNDCQWLLMTNLI